ncbi:hypothetical protein E3E11_03835 [Oecophyllibacter saccharovorans]|uniref:hypothetical protein n=1 Tax=Oecophyllibacter saccharovorans TaxID=2558360 RepID=UPI001141F734|nr:hypothetical protein [Oecophyllibacter saccharovorans]QDH15132.1 hypothetical protein E3E11_03835 [Oecophyllibacter saccharovorans]
MKKPAFFTLGLSLLLGGAGITTRPASARPFPTALKPAQPQSLSLLRADTPLSTSALMIQRPYQAPDGRTLAPPVIGLPGAQIYREAFTLGAESAILGGIPTDLGFTAPEALSIVGRPYGNYNAGCTLCVFSTPDNLHQGGAQAALSGIDFRMGAFAVAHGDAAVAGFYQYDELSQARVTARATRFTATTVSLARPMTDAEMALLHQGMYLATNVVDPHLPPRNWQGLPNENAYWGFIKSWTPTSITVYGWAVLGAGNAAGGQVPDPAHLDTLKSSAAVPLVFAGVPAKIFSKNTYVSMDADRIYGPHPTARANAYEREELDFRPRNFTRPHSMSFHGWTTSYECDHCAPNASTDESYAYLVNGPGLKRAYVAQLYSDGLEFSGYNTWLPGNGAPQVQGDNHILFDFASDLPTRNTLHFGAKVFKDTAPGTSWTNWDVRLGLNIDGQRSDRMQGGVDMVQLAWNYQNAPDTLCLLSAGNVPGLCQDSQANAVFHGKAHFQDAVDFTGTRPTNFANGLTLHAMPDGSGLLGGQGTTLQWNDYGSQTRTSLVNIDPSGKQGGFTFYDINADSSGTPADLLLSLSKRDGLRTTQPAHFGALEAARLSTGPITAPGSAAGPAFPAFPRSRLPASTSAAPLKDGQHARCTDCTLNGRTGVDVVWNAASARWTDMMNNPLH